MALDEPIALHVGVNSGVAAVGATKIEGKAGDALDVHRLGPVTNVAARLAALGAGDGVLIGPETARRIEGWSRPRGYGRARAQERGRAGAGVPSRDVRGVTGGLNRSGRAARGRPGAWRRPPQPMAPRCSPKTSTPRADAVTGSSSVAIPAAVTVTRRSPAPKIT